MVRFTDHPDMTIDVYHGRKTTTTTITMQKVNKTCANCENLVRITMYQRSQALLFVYNNYA